MGWDGGLGNFLFSSFILSVSFFFFKFSIPFLVLLLEVFVESLASLGCEELGKACSL